MKRTAVAGIVGGLMFLLAAPAQAQTGPQLIFCGYPVQVCAPAPGAQQQQQQQQQQVVVAEKAAATAPAATATAAASAGGGSSPSAGTGGGRVAFTGANVIRLSLAALVLMAGGGYLLLKSRRRSRWMYEQQ